MGVDVKMKTFIISMDTPNGQTRLAKLTQQCMAEGLDDIERIVGVGGENVPPEDISEMCQTFCSPGMIGCGISHIKCWRTVVEQNLPYALILEDDAYLLPNFRRKMMAVLLDMPEDYHMLLLGCFLCEKSMPTNKEQIRSVKNFAGTHAYIVSQKGARFLVENIPKVTYHIDVHIARLPDIRLYATKTNLAVQNGENTSTNTYVGFPGSLNSVLKKIKDGDNMSLSHYLNSAYFRLGTMKQHVIITPLVLLFVILGFLGVPWEYMALYSVSDIALYPPSSLMDPATKLAFYVLGLFIRRTFKCSHLFR